jgi:hypothetical protein
MALRKVKTKSGTLLGFRIVKPRTLTQKAKANATRKRNKMRTGK